MLHDYGWVKILSFELRIPLYLCAYNWTNEHRPHLAIYYLKSILFYQVAKSYFYQDYNLDEENYYNSFRLFIIAQSLLRTVIISPFHIKLLKSVHFGNFSLLLSEIMSFSESEGYFLLNRG